MGKDVQYYYWDACPFCAVFNKEEGRVENCRQVLKSAESGDLAIVTSALTIAEVVRVKNMERLPRGKEGTLNDFFQHEFIKIVAVDWFVASKARRLIFDYPALKPMDAIHLATAIRAKFSRCTPTMTTCSLFRKRLECRRSLSVNQASQIRP